MKERNNPFPHSFNAPEIVRQLPHLDLIQRKREEHDKFRPYTQYIMGHAVKITDLPEYVKPVIDMHKEQGTYREIKMGEEVFCYFERSDRIEDI